jgi:hypothetical protein
MVREFERKLRRWSKGIAAAAVLGWTVAPSLAQTPAPTAPIPTSEAGSMSTNDGTLVNHRRSPAVEVQPLPSAMPSQSCPPGVTPGTPGMPAMPGTPAPSTMPPGTTTPPGTPQMPPPVPGAEAPGAIPQAPPTAPVDQSAFAGETGGAAGGTTGFNAPNVIGNFLGTAKTLSFGLLNIGGTTFGGNHPLSTRGFGSQIADDNSAVPRDRIGYKFEYYKNTNQYAGVGQTPNTPPPATGTTVPYPVFDTKDYDTYVNGLDFEKTFADGMASVEVRVPVVSSASSHQNLSYGQRIGPNQPTTPGSPYAIFSGFGAYVIPIGQTPAQSLGHSSTEMGNMDVILKAVAYKNDDFVLSGGLGIGIPTGDDTNVTVNGVAGVAFPAIPTGPFAPGGQFAAIAETTRRFQIGNETWGLSPFLAYLYAPKQSRWFTQGFLEVETPLNSEHGTYTETVKFADPTVTFVDAKGNPIKTSINDNFRLREQALMHLSSSTGFWLVQNQDAPWIKGIAPAFELHYTQSLTKGRSVTLEDDGFALFRGTTLIAPQPSPTVGRSGNVEILDATVGTTFLIGDRSTLALGVSLPVFSGESRRTYDYELQLQFNYYFGAGFGRRTPNVQ